MRKKLLIYRIGCILALVLAKQLSFAQYCPPPSDLGTVLGSYINSVQFSGVTNPSGPSTAPYYSFFSNLGPPLLEVGNTYTITLVAGSMPNDYFAAWVDWNNDLDFTDPGELIDEQTNTLSSQTLFFNLTVPASATTSYKRMRIRCGPNVNLEPCLNYTYGETEDYTLLIQPAPLSYCVPSSFVGGTEGDFIAAVGLNEFLNYSGMAPSPYYAFADTLAVPKITKGTRQRVKLKGGSSISNNKLGAWIDWNRDGDFYDLGELLGEASNTQSGEEHELYFDIPTDVLSGIYRMRVRSAELFSGSLNPCANYTNAETEDYRVEVIDSVENTCVPTFSQNNPNTTFINRVFLDVMLFDLFPAAGPNYYLDYSNQQNFASLKANKSYMLYMGADGSAYTTTRYAAWIDYNRDGDFLDEDEYLGQTRIGSNYGSEFIQFQAPAVFEPGRTRLRLLAAPNGAAPLESCGSYAFGECKDFGVELFPFSAGLCVPSAGSTAQGDFIQSLSIGNTSVDEGNWGGSAYHYYGDYVHQATPGEQLNIALTGGGNTQLPIIYAAWIDWNNNLEYEDSEQISLDTSAGVAYPALQFQHLVPLNQASGFVHLRVRAIRNAPGDTTLLTACSSHSFGETEDYRIYIQPNTNSYCENLHSNAGSLGATIDAVRLNYTTLHKNQSGCEAISGNAYSQWPISDAYSGTMQQLQAYYLGVRSNVNARMGAWLDLNQNGEFENAEFYSIFSVIDNQFFFLISIPSNPIEGYTTLRIRVREGGQPIDANEACAVFDSGETEDYVVYISKARGAAPIADFDVTINGLEGSYVSTSANFPDYWTWMFPGTYNSSASGDNAIVYYASEIPGCKSAALTASNFFGSDTYINPCAIYIPEVNTCNSLLLSEYVCSSTYNRALEVVNASPNAVNLDEWSLALYPDGNSQPSITQALSGTLLPYETFVLTHPAASPSLQSLASLSSGVCAFDGNDAVALLRNGAIVDVVGRIGENPLSGWSIGNFSTQNVSMRRDIAVAKPEGNWTQAQNGWLAFEADSLSNLGQHTFACGTFVEPIVLNADFTLSDTLICVGNFITLNDLSTGNPSNWTWTLPGSALENASGANPGAVYYLNAGVYSAGLVISNAFGFDAEVLEQAITVLDYPNPQLEVSGNMLVCAGCAENNSWILNGIELLDETASSIELTTPGEYSVITSNSAGCEAASPLFTVFTVHTSNYSSTPISVYPNPSIGVLSINLMDGKISHEVNYELIDVWGRVMQSGILQPTVSIEALPSGNYYLRLWEAGNLLSVKHIVKQ